MLRSRVVVATFLVASCASCGHSGATPQLQGATAEAPSSPTTSVSTGLASYTPDEQAAYASAVADYDSYSKQNDQFYAAGATTVEAKDFFQKYAIDWSSAWANLAQVTNNHIRVGGATRTIWTKPQLINIVASPAVIVLRRCLDESARVVTQNGSKIDQPELQHPHVYMVRMERRPGEDWWRAGTARQGSTC